MSRQFGLTEVPFQIVTVSAAATEGTAQRMLALPFDGTIEKILIHASAVGTGTNSVDIYDSGLATPASVMVANTTVSAANTVYETNVSTTYSSTEYKQGRLFSIRAITGASTGALTNLQVVLLMRRSDQ